MLVVPPDPFMAGGIAFMICHPPSARGHGYNVVAMDHFIRWAKAMMPFDNLGIPLVIPGMGCT